MPLPLFPYQEEGAHALASRSRYGLHDEMGIGKTAQLIRAINLVGGGRGVVIGPASLRENFIGEYRKFGQYPLRLCKGNNIHDYVAWQRGRFDTLVTSYEQATKWWPRFKEHGEFLDFIAIDEAHYLKNVTVARTIAIMGKEASMTDCWSEWCEHGWHSTGTPIPNDPADVYTFLRFCGVMPLNYGSFIRRYFFVTPRAFGSRQTVKPEMVGELQALIENNRIRRTKKSIGLQLPPIFLTTFLVDGDASEINRMLREYPGLENAILMALEQGGLSFLDAQHVGTLRRLIGEAKAVPYAHLLLEELQFMPDAKRVVFGVHVNALNYVKEFMNANGVKTVGIQGSTSEKDRIEAVRAFQNDPDCRVFVGNIRAAGVGLTLTAASDLDMLESDWTPAGNAQAIMRVHRIGQQHNVRARFITLAQSFDETVNDVVAGKTAAIAEIEGEAMIATPGLDSR